MQSFELNGGDGFFGDMKKTDHPFPNAITGSGMKDWPAGVDRV